MGRCFPPTFLVGLAIMCSSCSTLFGERNDLFKTGELRLAVDEVRGCTLEAVAVAQDGHLLVSGRMTLRHHPDAPLSGGVTGEIVGPSGGRLASKSTPFRAYAHGRHLHPAAKFELTFEQVPPPGSLVKLSHTLRPFDGSADDLVIR